MTGSVSALLVENQVAYAEVTPLFMIAQLTLARS